MIALDVILGANSALRGQSNTFPFGGGTWDHVRGKAYCTDCKLLAAALAFLGSERLGEPVGARAEAKGTSFDPHTPTASHYLCLDLERPRGKLGGL